MSKGYLPLAGGIWGEGIGAEVLEPAAFGTSVLLNKSPYSRPFISHVPFSAVPPQPSIRRSIWTVYTGYFDWVCCTSSMSIYICQSCGIYTECRKVTDDVALLGGYKYDCCMFLSKSDHQVLIQDLEIVCPWILKHAPIYPDVNRNWKYVSVWIMPNQIPKRLICVNSDYFFFWSCYNFSRNYFIFE